MRVGIDCVEVSRIEKLINSNKNLESIFSKTELENISKSANPSERASGYFAAKEAVLKAFEVGLYNGIKLNEICVYYKQSGAPAIEINSVIRQFMNELNVSEIEISISHTSTVAVSVCTLL